MEADTTEKKPKQRIWQFDLLRVLACLLVLLVHVSAQWLQRGTRVGTWSVIFAESCNVLAFSGVSLFMMLSGALALQREMTAKEVFLKRFLRYVLLYEFWRVLYFIFYVIESGQAADPEAWVNYVLKGFFKIQGHYHLWYLPVIVLVFLFVPLIQKGAQELPNCLLYIAVAFLLGILIPTVLEFDFKQKIYLESLAKPYPVSSIGGYLAYFLLGHVLYKWKDKFRGIIAALFCAAGLAALIVACLISAMQSIADDELFFGLADPLSPFNFLCSGAIFLGVILLGQGEDRTGKNEKSFRVLAFLADASFGVYLLHPAVLTLLTDIRQASSVMGPALGIPCLLFLLYTLTLLLTLLLKRIPLIRRCLQ